MNFQQVLNDNYAEVKRLLRRRKVIGDVNPATIEKGFNRHGERFMLELLEIITPDDSSFTGLISPQMASDAAGFMSYASQNPVSGYELEKEIEQKGKFWGFWDNLLNRVDSTGKAIGQLKYDAAGYNAQVQPPAYMQQAQSQKNLLMIGGGLLAFILVLLIIFKK
jgi:hypothetical protein